MSGNATGWVLAHGPHPDDVDRTGRKYGQRARGFRAVLLTIADAANHDGLHAHPGIAAMCRGSLYSRRQVQNIEDELVAERWVVITEKGGGRMKATVFDLNMAWREKVQPAPPEPERKGATAAPETVQPAVDTAQPGLHPNGVATNPSTTTAAEGSEAHDVVRGFYEWCAANGRPKPTLPAGRQGNQFMALVHIVQSMLDAGWKVPQVKVALTTTPAFTTNAITLQLNQQQGRPSAGPGPRAPISDDRDGPSGRVDV